MGGFPLKGYHVTNELKRRNICKMSSGGKYLNFYLQFLNISCSFAGREESNPDNKCLAKFGKFSNNIEILFIKHFLSICIILQQCSGQKFRQFLYKMNA